MCFLYQLETDATLNVFLHTFIVLRIIGIYIITNIHLAMPPILFSTPEVCGTPGYLAPEIIECSMDPNHRGYGTAVDM